MTPKYDRYRRVLRSYQQTSREAWDAVWAALPAVDARIVRLIAEQDGATSDEIERYTAMKHQTVSAQIRHMVEGGLLQDSGARRRNENGRPCIVWTLAPQSEPTTARQPSLFTAGILSLK